MQTRRLWGPGPGRRRDQAEVGAQPRCGPAATMGKGAGRWPGDSDNGAITATAGVPQTQGRVTGNTAGGPPQAPKEGLLGWGHGGRSGGGGLLEVGGLRRVLAGRVQGGRHFEGAFTLPLLVQSLLRCWTWCERGRPIPTPRSLSGGAQRGSSGRRARGPTANQGPGAAPWWGT